MGTIQLSLELLEVNAKTFVEVYDDMLNNGLPKLFKSKDNITFRYRQTRIRSVGATNKLEFSGRFYRQADGNDNAQAV